MFIKKHKKLLHKSLALVFASLLLAIGIGLIRGNSAQAMEPLCYQALFASNGPGACAQNPGIPVEGESFKEDKCYELSTAFGTQYWKLSDCTKAPFNNSNSQKVFCQDGTEHVVAKEFAGAKITPEMVCKDHGGAYTANPPDTNKLTQPLEADCDQEVLNRSNCKIIDWLLIIINALSGLVALVIIISIIVAGIQWSMAGNNPQQVSQAKGRIVNALIALLVFIFMYAFLQWVVPGGIL
jgi:hypothetical protein